MQQDAVDDLRGVDQRHDTQIVMALKCYGGTAADKFIRLI